MDLGSLERLEADQGRVVNAYQHSIAVTEAIRSLSLMGVDEACRLLRKWSEVESKYSYVGWRVLYADPAEGSTTAATEHDCVATGESRALVELRLPHARLVHLGRYIGDSPDEDVVRAAHAALTRLLERALNVSVPQLSRPQAA